VIITTAHAEKLGDLTFRPVSLRLNAKETLALINELPAWHKSDLKPPASAIRYHTE